MEVPGGGAYWASGLNKEEDARRGKIHNERKNICSTWVMRILLKPNLTSTQPWPYSTSLALLLTNRLNDIPANATVCKFKFVRYGHKKIAIYVSQFNFDDPAKSEASHLK